MAAALAQRPDADATVGHPMVLPLSVAVLDGPIQRSHPALAGASIHQDLDPAVHAVGPAVRHGTAVASLIFGRHRSEAAGPGLRCRGLSVPIFFDGQAPEELRASQQVLAHAIHTAVSRGANIINISAGHASKFAAAGPELSAAIAECERARVLVIAAAGAGGCRRPQVPSNLPGVVAVEALGPTGQRPGGTVVASGGMCLAAPGENVVALAGGGFESVEGSSYACALVTRAAGMVAAAQANEGLPFDPEQVKRGLLAAVRRHPSGPSEIDLSSVAHQYPDPTLRQDTAPRLAGPPSTVGDVWELDDAAAAVVRKYSGADASRFGTVEVTLPSGGKFVVGDLLYPTFAGSVGMRLVAASDDREPRHHELDRVLREAMGLEEADDLYAILSYVHPEEHRAAVSDLPLRSKLYLGHRHIGAYLGQGRTSHALAPDSRWRGDRQSAMALNLDHHPANVQIVEVAGVPAAALNRNARMIDAVVASRARVPRAPDSINCRAVDLRTTLMYYRDLLLGRDYLEDLDWYTNCSVHKLTVINLAVNVPHNRASFLDLFEGDGERTWKAFTDAYEAEFGTPWDEQLATDFVPLWQLDGLSLADVRPLSEREYHRYHAAARERRLEEHDGPQPLPPGAGMAWTPENLGDVLGPFVDTYCPVSRVGVVATVGCWLLLQPVLADRIGLAADRYFDAVTPLLARLLATSTSRSDVGDATSIELVGAELKRWLLAPDAPHVVNRATLEPALERILVAGRGLQQVKGPEELGSEHSRRREIANLRYAVVENDPRNGLFASPGIFHKLALGIHPSNPHVRVRTVCTLLDRNDVRPVNPRSPADLDARKEEPMVPEIPFRTNVSPGTVSSEATAVGPRVDDGPIAVSDRLTASDPGLIAVGDPTRAKDPALQARAGQLVYALGTIGYDFPTAGRRMSFQQSFFSDRGPDDVLAILSHLDESPADAEALQWTLNIDAMPAYVLLPQGPFASVAYATLRRFLREQVEEGVERVSLPGVIAGTARQRSGAELPVINPEVRGMYSWTTQALVESVTAQRGAAKDAAGKDDAGEDDAVRSGVANFLDRVYYEIRNLGTEPWERAVNYAATNAFEAERVFEAAISENMELDTISVEPSPIAPAGSSYWDVKLAFFFPDRPHETVRRVYRFSVTVDDVVPATVGPMRAWYSR